MRRLDSFEAKDLILWLNEQKGRVVPASDLHAEPPYLRLQFDVDFSLPWAHRIAELLGAAEIQATFSVLVGGAFYDLTSAHALEGMDRIARFGHDFALHFDPRRYAHRAGLGWPPEDEELVEAIHAGIRQDAAVMEALGFPPAFCNPHRPFRMGLDSSWTTDCPLELPELGGETYVSDSAKGLRDESLELLEDPPERLRLCLHPAWWTVDLPRKETIQARLSQIVQLLQAQAAEWGQIDHHPGAAAQDDRDARSGNPKRQARAAASQRSQVAVPDQRVIVPNGVLANGRH